MATLLGLCCGAFLDHQVRYSLANREDLFADIAVEFALLYVSLPPMLSYTGGYLKQKFVNGLEQLLVLLQLRGQRFRQHHRVRKLYRPRKVAVGTVLAVAARCAQFNLDISFLTNTWSYSDSLTTRVVILSERGLSLPRQAFELHTIRLWVSSFIKLIIAI